MNEQKKSKIGIITNSIKMMMADDKVYGRVTFYVSTFKQHRNTRNAAISAKNRYGFDIYTMAQGCRLHVIRRGCENMPAIIVDLRDDTVAEKDRPRRAITGPIECREGDTLYNELYIKKG